MKLLTQKQIEQLILEKKITMVGDTLILDEEYITKKCFVKSMQQFCGNNTRDIDDKNDYRKCGQKSREKRRKCK
jgi:hypothetical protein